METTSATDFGWLARALSIAARSAGLKAPGFRSPPKSPGRLRTVRRYAGGNCLVSVQTRARDRRAVIEDMVEGVIVANGLSGNVAAEARLALLRAVATTEQQHAA